MKTMQPCKNYRTLVWVSSFCSSSRPSDLDTLLANMNKLSAHSDVLFENIDALAPCQNRKKKEEERTTKRCSRCFLSLYRLWSFDSIRRSTSAIHATDETTYFMREREEREREGDRVTDSMKSPLMFCSDMKKLLAHMPELEPNLDELIKKLPKLAPRT